MQNNKLPNSALSVSSQYNGNTGPENARLHFYAESGRKGAWVAQKQDLNQWLQVDFGVETVITRIATQGRQDANQWVKKYTLRYSTDGSYFKHYQPFGYTKVTFYNSRLDFHDMVIGLQLSEFLSFSRSYLNFESPMRFNYQFPLLA